MDRPQAGGWLYLFMKSRLGQVKRPRGRSAESPEAWLTTSHGIVTTSILNLRTAGMSLSTFGSWSKNR